jgi:hypothetical protein
MCIDRTVYCKDVYRQWALRIAASDVVRTPHVGVGWARFVRGIETLASGIETPEGHSTRADGFVASRVHEDYFLDVGYCPH